MKPRSDHRTNYLPRRDRDRDRDRDRSFRDADRGRSPERSHRSPPRQANRRHPDYRDRDDNSRTSYSSPSRGSISTKSSPMKPNQGSDSATTIDTKSATKTDASMVNFTNLLCEKVYWYQRKKNTEAKLTQRKEDEARSFSRQRDFYSATDLLQREIKDSSDYIDLCNQHLEAVDRKLSTECSPLAPGPPLSSVQKQSDDSKSQAPSKVSDEELKKVDQIISELEELRAQFEKVGSQNKALEQELRALHEKHKSLEQKHDTLERRFEGSHQALSLRVTAVTHKAVEASMTARLQDNSKKTPPAEVAIEGIPSHGSAVTRDELSSALEEVTTLTKDVQTKTTARQDQIDSTIESIKSSQANVSNWMSQLEELPKNLPVLRELSGKASSLADLAARMPLLQTMMMHLPALEELRGKLGLIEGFSNKLPAVEQLMGKMPSLEKLVADLPALEHLSNSTSPLKDLLSYLPTVERELNRVSALDEKMAQYTILANELRKFEELSRKYTDVQELLTKASSLQSLQDEMPLLKQLQTNLPALQKLASMPPKIDEALKNLSNLERLETEMQREPQPISSASPSTETGEVREIVTAMLKAYENTLKQKLSKSFEDVIARRLQPTLNEQHNVTLGLESRVRRIEDKDEGLDSRFKDLSGNFTTIQGGLDAVTRKTEQEAGNMKKEVASLRQETVQRADYDRQIEDIRKVAAHVETIQFQVLHLDDWANNFSTRTLFTQMAKHVESVIPGNLSERINGLSQRVESLEYQTSEIPAKKRKVMNGEAVDVNTI